MQLAHAFLFNPDGLEGVPGLTAVENIVRSLLTIAPPPAVELRIGDVLLLSLAGRLRAVEQPSAGRRRAPSRRSTTERDLLLTLARDFAESAESYWHTTSADALTIDLARHQVYCVTIFGLSLVAASRIDAHVRTVLGSAYRGAFEVDVGNPLVRRLVIELLCSYCKIEDSTVTCVGDGVVDDYWTDWATVFSLSVAPDVCPTPYQPPPALLSIRGRRSELLLRRAKPTHGERVVAAVAEAWESEGTSEGRTFEFLEVQAGPARVQANKLMGYILNEDHPVGRHKARAFREQLGITNHHCGFLAEQLVWGLQDASIRLRGGEMRFGPQYHADIPVRGVNNAIRVVRSVWIIDADIPPRLVTAWIDREPEPNETVSALAVSYIDVRDGRDSWQVLYDEAIRHGRDLEHLCVPTTMMLIDDADTSRHIHVVSEGLTGTAWAWLPDGRHPFSRWLTYQNLAVRDRRKGVQVTFDTKSQSVERALARCGGFARVLRMHGIECVVNSRLL